MIASEPARLFGVIGWPVAHSRSPAMQNAALRALGLTEGYFAFAVEPARLATAISGAQALGFRGLNVTIPHKAKALALCEPDALAREVGAVNTLIFEGAHILGANTDVHGFRKLLDEAAPHRSFQRALVLGAGGAARAVVAALHQIGVEITVASRRGAPLTVGNLTTSAIAWEPAALASALAASDLLVDATPRGLDPNAVALDLSPLPDGALVLDLVVRRETRLTADARARGLAAETGTAMLLHQGAAALERWLECSLSAEVVGAMRAALLASLV